MTGCSDILAFHVGTLSFGEEDTFGVVAPNLDGYIGLVASAEVPDEEIEWATYWNINSGRDPAVISEGKHTLEGTLPVILQNARMLFYLMGKVKDVGTPSGSGAGTTTVLASPGATEITLDSVVGYSQNDFIEIDVAGEPEVRKIILITGNTLTLDFKVRRSHSIGSSCRGVIGPFTHYIDKEDCLPSMTLQAGFNLNSGNFARNFLGTKVDSAEVSCEEGGELTANLTVKSRRAEKSGVLANPTVLTNDPYRWHHGSLEAWGVPVARFQGFRMSQNNSMKPKWYMQPDYPKYIYEFIMGKRTLDLSCTVIPDDSTFWDYLPNPGNATTIEVEMRRSADDYLKFIATGCRLKTAPHSIPEEHETEVELSFQPQSMTIEAKDSIPYY